MSKISILGLSGSLRNARFRRGSLSLANEIAGIETEKDLTAYLVQQTKIRADDFLEAGLSSGAPFDEVYRALQRKTIRARLEQFGGRDRDRAVGRPSRRRQNLAYRAG